MRSTLVGHMKADARLVIRGRHRKARALSLPEHGTRSDMRSQRFSESGTKEREFQRRGSGKEVL